MPTDTVAQWIEHRCDMPKDLCSNSSECRIFYFFRYVLSFSATLAKRWKVQFRLGLAKNSAKLIQIKAYKYQKITIQYKYIYKSLSPFQEFFILLSVILLMFYTT